MCIRDRRLDSIEQEVREAVIEEATRRLRDTLQSQQASDGMASEVLSGTVSVDEAATRLLDETVARTRPHG